ncbi:helix-turn-helix domain-containing protein [Corynebacterium variabile]|uniref:AraC-family transcription regulator of iron proteins n=1 Tax=Corynebacterium variabile (strain DSM 44702 / CIP 107183 / JCM 12073 / NCIMB 30131) TaxID=858619 RepID=G0HA98_CORVD|nr:helix-turn-helix domain-containing protein [Corynebacterium variabile]AEK36114.1 AraC-family transcription regulator of iron proteins [Corynebacterium variabile DSM 44702]
MDGVIQVLNGQDATVLSDNQGFPGAHEGERTHTDQHCALWMFAGTATVRVHDADLRTRDLDIAVGECLVVPFGVPYELTVHPGGLLVPVLLPGHSLGDLAEPVAVPVDPAWNTWILHHFAMWVSPMRTPDYTGGEVVAGLGHRDEIREPATPVTSPAALVASGIRRNPADSRHLREVACAVGVSAQTLRRIFLRETGLTPGAWRTAVRLHAAQEYLAAGYAVEWVAHQVGFGSSHGFIRAFAERFGVTPARWARDRDSGEGRSERVLEAQRTEHFTAVLADRTSASAPPPPIPATLAVRRTYDGHSVMLWMYRGTARVSVDDRGLHLSEGDAVWMPAGHSHEVVVDAGSVALPMSFPVDLVEVDVADVVVTRVPKRLTGFMLHSVISNITLLRPEDYDPLEVLGVFGDLLERRRAMVEASLSMPTTPSALEIARGTLDDLASDRSAATWAEQVGVSARTVNRWFRDETGRAFARWRTVARMQRATELMDRGLAPSMVARRVGYAHLSAFSRDFREHVGMSPREYVGEG